MTRGPLWIAVAAATAAAAWLVLRPSGVEAPEGGPDGALASEGEGSPDAVGAGTTAASLARTESGRATRTRAIEGSRGASSIVGVVRRDGRPVAATVDVVRTGDLLQPRSWRSETWIARQLDPPSTGPGFASARSGEDGKYAVAGIGVGTFTVRARAEDGARGETSVQVPVDGARVEANPTISSGAETLAGRVVHADGRPFQGVVVVAPATQQFGYASSTVVGDPMRLQDDGRFVATGLAPGKVTVTAYDPGVLRTSSIPVPIPFSGEFTFTVDSGTQAVAGRVVADADGSAVPGATVLASGQGMGLISVAAKAAADVDGRFTIPLPMGRGVTLIARAAGFAASARTDVDSKSPLEIRLVRAARAAGRVTTAEGAGVEGLSVQAVPVSNQAWGLGGESGTTAADGAFALEDLFAGEAMIVADGKGFTTRGLDAVRGNGFNPLAVTLRPGETTKVDLVVVRGALLTGVVLAADGTPVAGAVVRVDALPRPDRPGRGGMGGGRSTGTPPTAATGADGAFALEGLLAGGMYVVTATAVGRAVARSDPITVDSATPARVELRLLPERRFEVSVVADDGGAPLAGASVSASVETQPGSWRGEGSWTTGPDGRALVGPLSAGAVRLDANVEGRLPPETQTVSAGETPAVTFRLKRGLSVSGKVLMPDKSPAMGLRIALRAESDRGSRWSSLTELDGTFTASGLAPGTYRISVEGGRTVDGTPLSGAASAVAGGDAVAIVLAPGASTEAGQLVVRVVDPDGRPISRARVSFASPSRSTSAMLMDGRAVLNLDVQDRDEGGSLTVSIPTTAAGTQLPFAPKTLTGVKPAAGEVLVKLDPGQSLAGFVRGPDGQGVRGALVYANERGDDTRRWNGGLGNAMSTGRTDAGGAYRLEGLGPDEILVSADVPPEFLTPEPVVARAGSGGLDLTLKAAASSTIVVVDEQDRPVAGAGVAFRLAQKPVDRTEPRRPRGIETGWNGMTDAKGAAEVGSLDPAGRYDLTVSPPEARDDLQATTLKDVAPREQRVRLDRGYALEVRVVDLSGKPVSGAQLYRALPGGNMQGEGERSPGLFRLRRLPAGEVTLAAAMPSVQIAGPETNDPRIGRLTTRADAGSVTIRIDPGVELRVKIEGEERRESHGVLIEEVADAAMGTLRNSPIWTHESLTWRGLKPDATYTLWIPAAQGGTTSCFRKGLRAGGEVRVTPEKGVAITGRLAFPSGATQVNVSAGSDLGFSAQGKADAEGRYEIPALPPGTRWRVSAHCRVGDVWWMAQSPTDVPAGSTLDLELKRPAR